MSCNLGYIPKHLHMELKPIIPIFSIGEELYYRADPEKCKKPYDNISLRDISHNRSFLPKISVQEDVLYNINNEDAEETYIGKDVVVLLINDLNNSHTFIKEYKTDDNVYTVILCLKHSPLVCMYPHSVFEITVNDVIVNELNYKTTLNQKPLKSIRGKIRQELTSMIQSGLIDSSENIETIEEP